MATKWPSTARLGLLAALLCHVALGCGADDPGGNDFDRDAIVRACVLASSCFGDDAPYRPVGRCVDQLERGIATGAGALFGPSGAVLEHVVACARDRAVCDEALTCASYGHDMAYCTANPGITCDGDIRVICDSITGWAYLSEDCASDGLHCQAATAADGSPTAVCTDGGTCDPMTFEPACNGSRTVTCASVGLTTGGDCASLGIPATCGEYTRSDGTTTHGCVAVGPDCDFTDARCDGTAVVGCSAGHEARLDCAAIVEGHCELVDGTATCVSDATECTTTTPDACDGANLVVCVDGRLTSSSCAALGYSGCGPVGMTVGCTM
jgi:hypothetical protein